MSTRDEQRPVSGCPASLLDDIRGAVSDEQYAAVVELVEAAEEIRRVMVYQQKDIPVARRFRAAIARWFTAPQQEDTNG